MFGGSESEDLEGALMVMEVFGRETPELLKDEIKEGRLESCDTLPNGTLKAKFERSKAAKATVAGAKAHWL